MTKHGTFVVTRIVRLPNQFISLISVDHTTRFIIILGEFSELIFERYINHGLGGCSTLEGLDAGGRRMHRAVDCDAPLRGEVANAVQVSLVAEEMTELITYAAIGDAYDISWEQGVLGAPVVEVRKACKHIRESGHKFLRPNEPQLETA